MGGFLTHHNDQFAVKHLTNEPHGITEDQIWANSARVWEVSQQTYSASLALVCASSALVRLALADIVGALW